MGFPVLSFSGATGKHLFLLFSQKVFLYVRGENSY